MDVKQIIHQLTAHFTQNADRIRSLESAISPTGDALPITARKYVAYGTAGFRGRASEISHLFYNVGLIAGLRCLSTKRSNLGVMITASHNPVEDNGVKIIDADGCMLESTWELLVEKFCNIPHHSVDQAESYTRQLTELISNHIGHLNDDDMQSGLVMLGHDTRPSSEGLVGLVKLGLDAWGPRIAYRDYGQLTTPALHYLVGESTLHSFRKFELEDYYKKLADGIISGFQRVTDVTNKSRYNPGDLVVDSAHGVGSLTMESIRQQAGVSDRLPVTLINTINDPGVLNLECGADYVKTRHLAPQNADQLHKRYASLDGDADRVVYFYLTQDGEQRRLHLLDGDKILALFAFYLTDMLKQHELTSQLTLGIVQTAYANGASTDYLIKQLGLQVDCVDTGVKHLHKRALNYDFGVYFEANGHGTIWVSDKAKNLIEAKQAIKLKQFLTLLNNYTGDAISDVLLVEFILNYYDWSVEEWDLLYSDRPNTLTKVHIANRELVKTTNAGRTCSSPAGLQSKIDGLVQKYGPEARSFVRASGTENVVRVYAECSNQDDANELAHSVGKLVIEMCNKQT